MNPQSSLTLPKSYPLLLQDIKTRIRESQIKAALAVNQDFASIGGSAVKLLSVRGLKSGEVG